MVGFIENTARRALWPRSFCVCAWLPWLAAVFVPGRPSDESARAGEHVSRLEAVSRHHGGSHRAEEGCNGRGAGLCIRIHSIENAHRWVTLQSQLRQHLQGDGRQTWWVVPVDERHRYRWLPMPISTRTHGPNACRRYRAAWSPGLSLTGARGLGREHAERPRAGVDATAAQATGLRDATLAQRAGSRLGHSQIPRAGPSPQCRH